MASGDEVLVAAGVHGPHTPRHGLDRNPLLCSYSFTMALASARSILVAPSPPEHLVVTGRGVPRGGWSQAACGGCPAPPPGVPSVPNRASRCANHGSDAVSRHHPDGVISIWSASLS